MSLLLLLFLPSAFAAEPYNLCVTTDFSSVDANLGIVQTKVIEMVIKDVNDAGGIKGRPINLIIQDNGSDPSRAVGNVKMFKEQYKCKVMLVDITSGVCLALKAWGETNKIPMVCASPQSNKITVENQKAWIFRACSNANLNINASLARIKKLGYTKIAFEGTTLAYGVDTLATVKELAPKYGLQLVHSVNVEPKTKDLSIQIKQMKDSGAQAVICADFDAETTVLARAMSAIGWKPYVIQTSSANFNSALGLVDPKLLEGWETVSIADSSRPLVKSIWKRAKAFAPTIRIDEDEKAIRAYDQVSLLVEALKAAKNIEDSESIRDAFYNISPKYEWATGRGKGRGGFTTAKNHLLDVNDLVIYVAKGGKVTPVK